MRVLTTDQFEKEYTLLPKNIQEKAKKQEKLFRENPLYPSLNTEKLAPKSKGRWSFRVDKSYRIVFRFLDGERVLFLNIGHHHWIYKITK